MFLLSECSRLRTKLHVINYMRLLPETWLDGHIGDTEIFCHKYTVLRSNRKFATANRSLDSGMNVTPVDISSCADQVSVVVVILCKCKFKSFENHL